MIHNITHTEAKKFIADGFSVRRSSWEPCRSIRNSKDGDYDHIMNFDLSGVIVDDCKKECDCLIGVYQETPEDKEATDWQVIE